MTFSTLQVAIFLRRRGVTKTSISRVIENIDPIFTQINSDSYSLSPGGGVDADGVRDVIAHATGLPVTAIEFVSIAEMEQILPTQENETADAYRRLLQKIRSGEGNHLEMLVRNRWGQALSVALASRVCEEGITKLLQANGLNGRLRECAQEGLGQRLGSRLQLMVWTSLIHYLAFTMNENEAGVEAFEGLLSLLMLTLPLFEESDRPGHWVVLTA